MNPLITQLKSFANWLIFLVILIGWLLSVSHAQAGTASQGHFAGVTETPTPTDTETPFPPTVTGTPSPTTTLTPEPPNTLTLIFTPSITPSITPSPTITLTPTITPTPTFTVTPGPSPTPTITPTPNCNLIIPGSFVVNVGDELLFTVTNNNPVQVTLTNTSLYWTDYYDPSMLVDYFRFGGVQYWNGDGFSSPTIQTSNVPFPANSTWDWSLDFDGYGNIYNVTHTIGPFSIELTFNNNPDCIVSATIPLVNGIVFKPTNGQVIDNQNQTNFEGMANDTGVGNQNGDGIERMHMVIINSAGNVISSGNRQDLSAPYCMWGNESPCPTMPTPLWNTLPNGTYTMIAWGKSSVTASWSAPVQVTFTLNRTLSTSTPTATPTPTQTATITRTPSPSPSLVPTFTSSPTEEPTYTPSPSPSSTSTVTATPEPSASATITPTPSCPIIMPGSFIVSGDDDLQFTVTNNNPAPVTLTNTTLYWTDYYDPAMYIDYFQFAGNRYWDGDDFDSPTTQSSNVPFPGNSTQTWDLDFDGYGNLYNVTKTIGPFSVELTFDNNPDCVVSAMIPAVVAEITNPIEGQIIGYEDRNITDFEVQGWDTGVGNQNGDGIERIHMVIINSSGTVISSGNLQDTSAPYCMWGSASPCAIMPENLWNTLPNGTYTMIAWAKSSVTASWSPPDISTFTLARVAPPGSVEGNVLLQGRTVFSDTVVALYDNGNLVEQVLTDVSGYYSFTVPGGYYELVVEQDFYLDAVQNIYIEFGTTIALPTVTLLGGDSNDSDTINILDLAFIGAHYNLNEGDPGWHSAADINGDGTVNLLDLTISASNFHKTSPVPW